jgi:MOSC domain-containing protein YiiM
MCPESSGPKFRCGVFGIVTAGGKVASGDAVTAEQPVRPWSPLPAMWRRTGRIFSRHDDALRDRYSSGLLERDLKANLSQLTLLGAIPVPPSCI